MVTVAVAGGTGNVGRTIVDAFAMSRKHSVIVLTRKVNVNNVREDYNTE
jgi:NAD dependent epimerase/dehydratase family enzyme